jgi:Lrp/AsnC family transcriptional regulator
MNYAKYFSGSNGSKNSRLAAIKLRNKCSEKVGLTTMVFAHVKLTSHGRSNLSTFADDVKQYPEVLDCYVVLGNVDFLLRIVTKDIKAYEQFFFEKLSQLPGIQEVTSSIVLSDIKHTTALPI